MNYFKAKKYLLSLARLPRREYLKKPKDCDWYLKRLQFFLDLLGNPEKKIPHYIHVTGTSGKGSVCLMLDSILRSAGKKVGTLTSPQPSEVLERWEVSGRTVGPAAFAALVTKIKPRINQCLKTTPYDPPSFPELTTALGLYYFARKKVSWAILEVGLGGRYDSTNIIPRKDVAIITNIGLDHAELIGPTKKEIAYEKAGIIKPGAAVFTSEQNKTMLKIIKNECHKQHAPLITRNSQLSGVKLNVLGEHQKINAALCVGVAKYLKIPNQAIKKGLRVVKLPVRMEIVSRRPLIILDGAHNPDKMRTTVTTISNFQFPISKFHLVVGFSADKNIPKMIKQLAVLKPTSIACTQFTCNKLREPAKPRLIAGKFRRLLPKSIIKTFNDPKAALNWSKQQQKNRELLLVTGSMFLAGELRNLTVK